MKIIFFGTPFFAAEILAFLIRKKANIAAVVTQPARGKGRKAGEGSAVKIFAEKLLPEVPLYQPEKASSPEFIEILRRYEADLFVVAAYGQILKKALLELPRFGAINVHGSILPKYRGAAPIQRAIMNGEKETGVTIMKIVPKLDAGDILAVAKTSIGENMNFQEVSENLIALAGPLLWQVIEDYQKGRIKSIPQDDARATYAGKITSEERAIDWSRSALELRNLIRALSPSPCAVSQISIGGQKKKIKIKKAKIVGSEQNGLPGSVLEQKDHLTVACGKGALCLLEVQLENKKPMAASAFLRGVRSAISFF